MCLCSQIGRTELLRSSTLSVGREWRRVKSSKASHFNLAEKEKSGFLVPSFHCKSLYFVKIALTYS